MEALTGLVVGSFYGAACLGAGLAVLAAFRPRVKTGTSGLRRGAHELTSAFLIGQGTLASLWLIVGLLGWFQPGVVYPVCGICAAWALFRVAQVVRSGTVDFGTWRIEPWSASSWSERSMVGTVIGTALGTGILSVAMPVRFGGGDGLFFYLVLPKVMAASGHLVPVPAYERSHSVFGVQGEMHAAAALLLGDERAALAVAWQALMALTAVTCLLAARLGVRRPGLWVVAALVLSSSAVRLVAFNGKTDVFAAALGVAAVVWAVAAYEQRGRRAASICGLLAGFAVAGKATYLASVPVICVLVMCQDWIARAWRRMKQPSAGQRVRPVGDSPASAATASAREVRKGDFFRQLAAFALAMVAAYSPQAVKNSVWFGDPLAAFTQVSTRPWNELATAATIVVTLPFALAFGDYLLQLGNVSPLFISYLPLLWIYRREVSVIQTLYFTSTVVAIVVLANAVATAGFFAPRFMLPALIALAPPLAFGAEMALEDRARRPLLAGATALAAAGALALYPGNRLEAVSAWRYFAGGADACTFDPANTAPCEALWAANRLVPEGSRIFYQGYSYYLRADLIECELAGDELGLRTSPRFWEDVFEHGFAYAVRDFQFPFGAAPEAAPTWLSVKRIFEARGQEVWVIQSLDPARRPSRACARVAPQLWGVVGGA